MVNKRIDRFFTAVLYSLPMILFSKNAFEIYFTIKDLLFELSFFTMVLYFIAPYLLINYLNLRTEKNQIEIKSIILIITNIMIVICTEPYNMRFFGNIDRINVTLRLLFYIVNVIYFFYYIICAFKSLVAKESKE